MPRAADVLRPIGDLRSKRKIAARDTLARGETHHMYVSGGK